MLVISQTVLKQWKALPKADAKRLLDCLELIAEDLNVRQPYVTEMVGDVGVWRARKGDWRAIYEIIDGDVVVRKVGNRKDIYK